VVGGLAVVNYLPPLTIDCQHYRHDLLLPPIAPVETWKQSYAIRLAQYINIPDTQYVINAKEKIEESFLFYE
jgi:hypothetical protein